VRSNKKTKIIATIGPAIASREMLEKMIHAGTDVFRLNFSHGTHEEHQRIIDDVRSLNKENSWNVAILGDLQGPKLRIGTIKDGSVLLKEGEEIVLTTNECEGDKSCVYITYKEFPKDVSIGDKILLDDGKLQLKVADTNRKDQVVAKVIHGGLLSSKKGVNLPNTKISLPSITEKDKEDLEFALKNNVEWIGLSFVRSAKDIIKIKSIISYKKKRSRVVAKIEKPEAIKVIDDIIDEADGIMVARGDLGVEIPMEELPLIQKMIVRKSIKASKPVIIATQMMESMINNASPTRAEVNDVANAVLDGADAVMLSAETSVGKYPVNVVDYMCKIISTAEKEESIYNREHMPELQNNKAFIPDSICYNACKMAQQANAKAIVAMSHSGFTAYRLASYRPKADIFIFTDNPSLLAKLSLVWGVKGFFYDRYISTDETISDIKDFLKEEKMVKPEDIIVNLASIPMNEKGMTNMIKLSFVS
jgi:pyruvate kinase